MKIKKGYENHTSPSILTLTKPSLIFQYNHMNVARNSLFYHTSICLHLTRQLADWK